MGHVTYQVEYEAEALKKAGKRGEALAYLRALKAFIISGDVSKVSLSPPLLLTSALSTTRLIHM